MSHRHAPHKISQLKVDHSHPTTMNVIATKPIKEPAACQNNQQSVVVFEFDGPTSVKVRARKVCQWSVL